MTWSPLLCLEHLFLLTHNGGNDATRHGTILPSKSKELITIVAARITGNNILEFYKKKFPFCQKRDRYQNGVASLLRVFFSA